MISNEEAKRLEQEWLAETGGKLGEQPGGHHAERIERQRGRKRWLHHSDDDDADDDEQTVEDLVDQMGD